MNKPDALDEFDAIWKVIDVDEPAKYVAEGAIAAVNLVEAPEPRRGYAYFSKTSKRCDFVFDVRISSTVVPLDIPDAETGEALRLIAITRKPFSGQLNIGTRVFTEFTEVRLMQYVRAVAAALGVTDLAQADLESSVRALQYEGMPDLVTVNAAMVAQELQAQAERAQYFDLDGRAISHDQWGVLHKRYRSNHAVASNHIALTPFVTVQLRIVWAGIDTGTVAPFYWERRIWVRVDRAANCVSNWEAVAGLKASDLEKAKLSMSRLSLPEIDEEARRMIEVIYADAVEAKRQHDAKRAAGDVAGGEN